jgi:diguanylate cyclase (GGDEF)-like protein
MTLAHFSLSELSLLVALAIALALALVSRWKYRQALAAGAELTRIATHDGLTGLPNRLALGRWQENGVRSGDGIDRLAVGFVDLDRFKLVNDRHGHEVGDQVVSMVADRLRRAVRQTDRVVRFGGDEFVVLFPDVPTARAAARIGERIIGVLEEPFAVRHERIRISASVGIALGRDHRDDLTALLEAADGAMYAAKRRGRSACIVIDRATDAAPERLTEDMLLVALERRELVLHYQPIVSLRDGKTIGAEALLRWDHPERGLLPPIEFLPLLEDSGLIVPVGTWVLEEACAQAERWNRQLPGFPPLQVNINVAPRQLAEAGFTQTALAVVGNAHIDAHQICLEITESALLDDIDHAWSVMRRVKDRGVRLALDDFGTGYSSLTHLRRFQLDVLKIDRTFVAGLHESHEDRAIVTHVASLARSLGMQTAGEGIETPVQERILQEAGCVVGQGYALGRPLPATAMVDRVLDEIAGRRRSPLDAGPGLQHHDRAQDLAPLHAMERVLHGVE